MVAFLSGSPVRDVDAKRLHVHCSASLGANHSREEVRRAVSRADLRLLHTPRYERPCSVAGGLNEEPGCPNPAGSGRLDVKLRDAEADIRGEGAERNDCAQSRCDREPPAESLAARCRSGCREPISDLA